MSLETHVMRECEELMKQPGADCLTNQYVNAIKGAYEAFKANGMFEHEMIVRSGIEMFKRAMLYLPLRPVQSFEENPDDWMENDHDNDGKPIYQCKRCTALFYYSATNQYRYIDANVFNDPMNDIGYTCGRLKPEAKTLFNKELEVFNLLPSDSAEWVTMPFYPPTDKNFYDRHWYQDGMYFAMEQVVEDGKLADAMSKTDELPPLSDLPLNLIETIYVSRVLMKDGTGFILLEMVDTHNARYPIVYQFDVLSLPESEDFQKETSYFLDSIKQFIASIRTNTLGIAIVPIDTEACVPKLNVLLPIVNEDIYPAMATCYDVVDILEHCDVRVMKSFDPIVVDMQDNFVVSTSDGSIGELVPDEISKSYDRVLNWLVARKAASAARKARAAAGTAIVEVEDESTPEEKAFLETKGTLPNCPSE